MPIFAGGGGGGGTPSSTRGNTWPTYDTALPAFTWVNQGTCTLSASSGTEEMTVPQVNGYALALRVINIPATPWRISATFDSNLSDVLVGTKGFGLCLYDGTLVKTFGHPHTIGTAVFKWTNVSTFSAQTGGTLQMVDAIRQFGHQPRYFSIYDDGTTWRYQLSNDGIRWVNTTNLLAGEARNTFLTATKVGWFTYNNGTSGGTDYVRLTSWTQTAS